VIGSVFSQNMAKTVDLSPVLLKLYELLDPEKLKDVVLGPQCYRKAYDLVKCGDVYQLQCEKQNTFLDIRVGRTYTYRAHFLNGVIFNLYIIMPD
jgi:hypothetical protein